MIPSTSTILNAGVDFEETAPSKTYRMNLSKKIISGVSDTIESVKQMIYKILNTERYKYLAYSWDFGIYTIDLYGKDTDYVKSELERRITEALVQDDRIDSVSDFEFNTERNKVVCTFTVHTIFGDVESEKVVEV